MVIDAAEWGAANDWMPPGEIPEPATPQRKQSREETLDGLTGIILLLHETAELLVGPEMRCTPSEAKTIARPLADLAELYKIELTRAAKPIAWGKLVTAVVKVERPKVEAVLARPPRRKRGGAGADGSDQTGADGGGAAYDDGRPRPAIILPSFS